MTNNDVPLQINLNESFIANMFAADSIHEPSEKLEVSSLRREDSKSFQIPPEPFSQNRDLSEFLHNDVSLNFTVTSRAANPLFDSLQLAGSELEKFNSWLTEFSRQVGQTLTGVGTMIEATENTQPTTIPLDCLQLIKSQLFRKDHEPQNARPACRSCSKQKKTLQDMLELLKDAKQEIERQEDSNCRLREEVESLQIELMRETLLSGTELQLARTMIDNLNADNIGLRSEKASLEKTNMFNKTKTSELQKSRGLSGINNSTFSSDLPNRNQQSMLFIDPIEPQINEWIKFFQLQCARYDVPCRREEEEYENKLGRQINQLEKVELAKIPVFIIRKRLHSVVSCLKAIRMYMTSFAVQDQCKGQLRERLFSGQENNLSNTSLYFYRQQLEKLRRRLSKLIKINEGLTKEKNNLEESNLVMKDALISQNAVKYLLEKEINNKAMRIHTLEERLRQIELELCQQQDEHDKCQLRTAEELKSLQQKFVGAMREAERSREQVQQYQNSKEIKMIQNKLKCLQKFNHETNQARKELELQNKALQFKLKKEKAQRKRMHNELEDAKGTIRVYCRIRPKLKAEQNHSLAVRAVDKRVIYDLNKKVQYDEVFAGEQNSQEDVFEETKKLVQSAIDGYNLCIFAYGQTGSGKTYTIHGTAENPGIAPRISRELFRLLQHEQDCLQVEIKLSMVEIYNDRIYDMYKQDHQAKPVQIKENKEGEIFLENCTTIRVDSFQCIDKVYTEGIRSRRVRQTEKNDDSSRSHFVMVIMLQCTSQQTNQKYRTKIHLIDLAGAEKLSSNDPVVAKETASINRSLAALSNVINALANKLQHVPYRDNKLTHLLKDSLRPNAKMLIFINVAPGENNKEESMNTLHFGQRIKQVERIYLSRASRNGQLLSKQIDQVPRRSVSRLSSS